MMTLYTPGETTKFLIEKARSKKMAAETFQCEWIINRDDEMNFVLQKGNGKNLKKIRVCLLVGKTEHISREMAAQIGAILSQLLKKYGKTESWLKFGFKKGSGPEKPEHLLEAKPYILQEIKLNMERIAA